MHKCIVCSNSSESTRHTRPDIIYHKFPKNEYIRRKWLKMYGINHCYDYHRICSDHFLENNYKTGRKGYLKKYTIPQPYDKNCFPFNCTQSIDVEMSNNEFLPIEKNSLKKVQNAVVNDFEPLRESCRYEHVDMSYENMAMLQTKSFERQISTFIVSNNIQTEIESVLAPMLTTIKNHNLGYRIRCSVKNCFNRHSKDLSFFGYPSDFTLRKKWIEKCGLSVDPTKKVKLGVKVCRVHFDDDSFKNTKLKNRLRPGAVPSLFLDNDKSMATTDEIYFSRNEIKECTAFTNDLDHQPVDFSCVKIEPLVDDDLQTNSVRKTDQIIPILKTKLVEVDDFLPLSSIDDPLSISLKNVLPNSSLSITLEPIENSKITEPSEDLFSKTSAKSLMFITIQLKFKHNLT